jgi:hypothetical protein
MRLSARMLSAVSDVNNFDYVDVLEFTEGDLPKIYFQLTDASVDRAEKGFVPAGRRYMPAAGATLTATLQSIDTAKTITRACTQPYAQDPSIWKLTLLAGDAVTGFRDLRLVLVEGTVTTNGTVRHAINVAPQNASY